MVTNNIECASERVSNLAMEGHSQQGAATLEDVIEQARRLVAHYEAGRLVVRETPPPRRRRRTRRPA